MKLPKKLLASKVNSVRPYKSRSKRPCDFCRRRKTCCIIENLIPCMACAQFNKGACTFVEGPLKRSNRKAPEAKAKRGRKKLDSSSEYEDESGSETFVPLRSHMYGSRSADMTETPPGSGPPSTSAPYGSVGDLSSTGLLGFNTSSMYRTMSLQMVTPSRHNSASGDSVVPSAMQPDTPWVGEAQTPAHHFYVPDSVSGPGFFHIENSRQLTLLLLSTTSSLSTIPWNELPNYDTALLLTENLGDLDRKAGFPLTQTFYQLPNSTLLGHPMVPAAAYSESVAPWPAADYFGAVAQEGSFQGAFPSNEVN